jgi:RNA polymerase sigma factor (sigma-70 family)
MADRRLDLYPEEGANAPLPTAFNEEAFLLAWDKDIKRAARAAATGDSAQREDFVQQARMRVLLAYRTLPDAPTPYIRTVIANTLRTALRREARSFNGRSPLAEKLDDDLAAPGHEPVDERAAAVSAWAERLPPRLRQICRHLYFEERSQREVARLMYVSQPRVAQLHRQLLNLGRQEIAHLAI